MIKGVVINMIKLLHYAMVYSSRVLLDKLIEYRNSYKRSYDYVHKPRYIRPSRDITVVHDTATFHDENDELYKRDSYGFPIQSKTK